MYLIEKEPCIGGKVARYEVLYPEMVCSSCLIEPQLDTVLHHDHIEVLTLTEILGMKGYLGNFIATVRQKSRFVNPDVCIGCGACFEACPVSVCGPFVRGESKRKAIHIPYPGALPTWRLLMPRAACGFKGIVLFLPEGLPFGAIRYGETDGIREIKVGAVVIATGFATFVPERYDRYAYGKVENILTSLEFEQLVNSTGPTEGKILLGDGRSPRSIAFVHCVGSRTKNFNEYCSGICCLYTLKHAHQARTQLPETTICQFHADLSFPGKASWFSIGRSGKRMMFISFACCSPILEIRKSSEGIMITHTIPRENGNRINSIWSFWLRLWRMEKTGELAGILDVKLGEEWDLFGGRFHMG